VPTPVDVRQAALCLCDGQAAQWQCWAGHGQAVNLAQVNRINQTSRLQDDTRSTAQHTTQHKLHYR
jgi:hypothetical protein